MQKLLRSKSTSSWSGLARRLKRFAGRSVLSSGLLMAGWLYSAETKAQSMINNYDFAASSGTYTPLDASATQMPLVKADTYLSPSTPIGFTFNFDGVDYTNFKASSNGFLSFNTTNTGSETANALSSSTARALVAPLWDDLDGNAAGGISNASYELTGAPGSQVLTFEWRNWEWNYNSADGVISFQVKLYEGSNKIEFIYNPEADAVNSGSASVGIAGVGTGAGNFISLNNLGASPTASYSTETTTISAKPAAGQVYTFTRANAAVDVTTTALALPVLTGCFGPNQTVAFTIKNNGTAPLDFATNPVTVTAAVTGTNATTFAPVVVNTGTLAVGATRDVVVSTTYNMSTAGTYTFNASATTAGEVRTINDALFTAATRTVTATAAAAPVALPQNVSFTGFTGANLTTLFPGWTEATGATVPSGTTSAWANRSNLGATNNVTAFVNLAAASKREWIVGPKITPTATTAVLFKAAVTTAGAITAHATGMAGTDDKVQVMVSTDCGVSYTPIYTIDQSSGLTNVLTNQFVSLAAYAGQNIVVAFFATEGTVDDTPSYDFHVDDLFIGTPPATVNLGATAFVTPLTTGCYSATETATVTIRNFGSTPIDFSATNATVSIKTTGAGAGVISTTLNTGTLAPGATQNVNVGTVNMTAAGTYNFRGYTTITGDTDASSDTTRTSRLVTPTATQPQRVTFTGFTGANLTTVFPGWTEASGTTPSGTTSTWLSDDFGNVVGGPNGIAARINLDAASDNVWIISPKITATATTSLQYDLALTAFGTTTAATMGSDDVLRVMISTDCGFTYTPIRTYSASTPISTTGQNEVINLGAYAGQSIIVAFYATEGTVNDAEDNDLFIDEILLGTIPAIDLGATALVNPQTTACFGPAENVTVTIKNYSNTPIDFSANNATVSVRVHGAVANLISTTVNTGTLAPGASQNVSVGTLNMQTAGTYNFRAYTTIATDGFAGNDTARTTRVVSPTVALPQRVDFTGFTGADLTTLFPNWKEATGVTPTGTTSSWTSSTVLSLAGNTSAKINLLGATKKEWIIGPKVTPTATTSLRFNAAITDAASANADAAGMQGTDDKVQVMVSNDCGISFTPIFTFEASNTASLTNVLTDQVISLAAYAGQNIIVAFFATEGTTDDTPSYDFHIDDVFIGTVPAIDLGATVFVTPLTTGCYTGTENVTVTIKNYAITPIDFSTNNATVSVRTTGGAANLVSTTLNTGTLAPGATQNVSIGNINMIPAGTYNFRAYTTVATDGFAGNDTARTTRTVIPAQTLPQTVDFTGFTGTNLNTLFPNWNEATGAVTATPTIASSNWVSSTGLGGANNTTARINLYTITRSDWMIGPKVMPTATTSLRFRAAITDFASLAADPAGMQGTDDKVQVMVSTNCGVSFTPIYTFDASNTVNLTNVLTDQVISLAPYAGQNIIIAFYGTDAPTEDTPDYDFHIDDIFIGTVAPVDVQALSLVTPLTAPGCLGNNRDVTVAVRNLGTSPIDFTANNTTVTVNVTGAATQTFTATINNNSLNNGAPLAPFGTINVTVGTLNMVTAGTYTFNASATTAADGNTANDAMAPVNTVASPVAAGTAAASGPSVCAGSTATLTLTGNTGGNIQWQQGTSATGPFTDIAGATTSPFTTTGLNQATFFRAVVSCGTTSLNSNVINVTVNDPQILTSTPATRCGTGTVTLAATATTGATMNWYTTATGGASVATGASFSPNVTATTTYYVAANQGGTTEAVGRTTVGTSSFISQDAGWGLNFTTTVPVKINHVHVYPTGTGTITIKITDLNNVVLYSTQPFALTGTGTQKIQVPVNITVPAGNFKIGMSSTGITNLVRESSGNTFPYTSPSGALSITSGNSGTSTSTSYYWFYEWSVSTGCESARTAVVATVNPLPVVNLGADQNVCGATSTTLDAGNAGFGYQWSLDGTPITGATAQTLVATANGTYSVTVTNPTTTCTGTDAVVVNFFTATATPTITAGGPTTFCAGGSVVLTAASTTTGATYAWFLDGTAITGATSATFTANAAGNYTVVATAPAGGCTATSTATAVTVNALPTPVITGLNASYCQNATAVTLAGTPTGSTFTIDGVAATTFDPATLTVGTHTVVISNTNAANCTATATQTVSVTAAPVIPTITAGGATTFCTGGSVTLTAASTTTGATYAWFLNGTAITGATSATYTANASGNYTVVASANGCDATSTATAVTLNATPSVPTITAGGATTFCAGGSVVLTAASTTTGATYAWFLDGTAITGATAAAYTANAAGNYTVVATANGCDATSTATAVTVNATPATPTISQNGGVLTSSSATGNQWYLNGTLITGATGQVHTTTANGTYTVIVTTNGCPSVASAPLNMISTGIAADLNGMSVSVYPNPNHGKFEVKLKGYNQKATIYLYNLAGQLIRSQVIDATSNEVVMPMQIENLAAGTYLLKVTSDKGVKVERMIVE